jgi:phospholipid N-methyltransferase
MPFSIMPREVRGRILAATARVLKPGAPLIGYQYSPAFLAELRGAFPAVHVRFEPRNWPPAFVFTARG